VRTPYFQNLPAVAFVLSTPNINIPFTSDVENGHSAFIKTLQVQSGHPKSSTQS
jgi:hypothetical protein